MRTLLLTILLLISPVLAARESAAEVYPPYGEPKVLFEFYFDHPEKIGPALYWIRSLINPLSDEPYNLAPEFMNIKVVIHGTELVTVVKKNYDKYRNYVERMRYYAELGVEFKVCGLAAIDYGYRVEDFQDFIDVVPSSITELVYWQQQGYALIIPQITSKKLSIEEIR